MKIKKVEIEGFRAYQLKKDGTFDFTNPGDTPSNFVAIYAPNGFGKSSFYDAVEWAVTNHLERLGGEHNRKNYELAAKSTKQDGVGQKILRNKDVPDKVTTCVTVSTTWKDFKRTLPRPKSNSRDLQIRDNRRKEADYFRKVVLTQDAIDRFLREAKPQERYMQFMEHFGGDAEQFRQELTALINDNNLAIDNLRLQRAELQEKLRQPIDESIFDQFNLLVDSLNQDGESVPLATPDLSDQTEREILSLIVTRSHELKNLREASLRALESLDEQSAQLPEIELNLELIKQQEFNLARLSKGVEDSQRFETLQASQKKYTTDIQSIGKQLEDIKNTTNQIPLYISAEADLKVLQDKIVSLSKQRNNHVSASTSLESAIKLHTGALANFDQRALLLRATLNNSASAYAEIAAHQATLASLRNRISEFDIKLALDKSEQLQAESQVENISAIQIDIDTLLTKDISAFGIDALKISKLGSLEKELNLLDVLITKIRETQEALNQQMDIHEKLISFGLEYLSAWPTDTCPLCRVKHTSQIELKTAVESSSLASSLVVENTKKLEDSIQRKEEIKSLINSILVDATSEKAQHVAERRSKVRELGKNISITEQDRKAALAHAKSIEELIKNLQSSVWNLEKDELERRVRDELVNIATNREEKLSVLTKNKLELEQQNASILTLDTEIAELQSQISTITQYPYYKTIREHSSISGIKPNQLAIHFKERYNFLERTRQTYSKENESIAEQCVVLQAEMSAAGNWIDFKNLEILKSEVEEQIARLKGIVDLFFEIMKRTLGNDTDLSISSLKSAIKNAALYHTEHSNSLIKKIEKYSLLSDQLQAFKPYFDHLLHRKSLVSTERELAQREQVHKALSNERNIALEKIKECIDSFFFTDLINAIYRKIDPHPEFKEVEFLPDFDLPDRPGLNVTLKDESGNTISPILYFSAAQLNILSLSVFLANALHATDDKGTPLDVILIDDPIQAMDSINVLSTIDLLRSISVRFDKQIIISTHDENFFGLLQRKVPTEVFGSKFLRLESFGVVAPVDALSNSESEDRNPS